MKINYSTQAKADLTYWKRYNSKIFQRIQKLITDICNHPFTELGKPEPLKFKYSGYWSRRIDQEHRLVYKVVNQQIYIAQCRYHYA